MSKKHAFVVYSGSGETGRVFHALVHAKQALHRGDVAEVYFAAEGTFWPAALAQPDHAMHGLFDDLLQQEVIRGACENCARAFGHAESAGQVCSLISGPQESFGQIDILGLEDAGYRVWLF